jgi:lipopolysaccharide/colanic/teichoic acid biosynthesis glycosyltransferase
MSPPKSVRFTKRVIDVIGATTGLAITWPLFVIIAAAVRLESKGPVIFKQKRVRSLVSMDQGKLVVSEFVILKFRTMCDNAEQHTGAVLAQKNDQRVTRIGRLLRKTRLDELPQFINILRGEMSLVGPRPERLELLADLASAIPFFEERLRDVKPGLTGLAQVALGYTGAIPEGTALAQFRDSLQNPFDFVEASGSIADDMRIKMLYDLAYSASLERFSTYLPTELGVILKTPLVMLRGSGE